jgi:polyisoprenoid-binding protein YceI
MTTNNTDRRPASATRWSVEPGNSSVSFAVKTFWGAITVRGTFDRFEGFYEVGPEGTKIALTVDVDSLDTGNAKRDKHLRSDDFFHLAQHPQVRFTSTRVRPAADGMLLVEGNLEVAGEVLPLELAATVQPAEGGLEIAASTALDPAQFGMSRGQFSMIRPPAVLTVTARLSEENASVEAAA